MCPGHRGSPFSPAGVGDWELSSPAPSPKAFGAALQTWWSRFQHRPVGQELRPEFVCGHSVQDVGTLGVILEDAPRGGRRTARPHPSWIRRIRARAGLGHSRVPNASTQMLLGLSMGVCAVPVTGEGRGEWVGERPSLSPPGRWVLARNRRLVLGALGSLGHCPVLLFGAGCTPGRRGPNPVI